MYRRTTSSLWIATDPAGIVTTPLKLLDREGLSPDLAQLVERLQTPERASPWLLCRACEQRITEATARIPIHRHHQHTFTNPHGFVYTVGCFDSAPGVVEEGEPSSFWSWFPGYHWQIVVCLGCRWHLGWRFSGEDSFFALVLDRLNQPPPT